MLKWRNILNKMENKIEDNRKTFPANKQGTALSPPPPPQKKSNTKTVKPLQKEKKPVKPL